MCVCVSVMITFTILPFHHDQILIHTHILPTLTTPHSCLVQAIPWCWQSPWARRAVEEAKVVVEGGANPRISNHPTNSSNNRPTILTGRMPTSG